MTRPSGLGRASRNRHRHAIEQASRRWRGTRRKILISTQVTDADGTPYTPLTRQIVAAGACHGDLRALVDSVRGARLDDED